VEIVQAWRFEWFRGSLSDFRVCEKEKKKNKEVEKGGVNSQRRMKMMINKMQASRPAAAHSSVSFSRDNSRRRCEDLGVVLEDPRVCVFGTHSRGVWDGVGRVQYSSRTEELQATAIHSYFTWFMAFACEIPPNRVTGNGTVSAFALLSRGSLPKLTFFSSASQPIARSH
jgi:hypothetical protein